MKVSVVIPAYNEEKLLGRCLESLNKQIEKPLEIIIVDNNSTDKTAKIAKQFGARVIKEKKRGTIAARNKGFNLAKGEIIARTDADTIVPRNWTKRIRKDFEKDPTLLGLSGSAYFCGIPKMLQYKQLPATGFSEAVHFTVMKNNVMFGFNLALTKKAWKMIRKEICLKDKDVHEDADLAIHLAAHGKVIYDKKLVVESSPRRIKNFESYFEYPYRYLKTIRRHKKLNIKIRLSKNKISNKAGRLFKRPLKKFQTI